jgi:hypothetical protein
MDAQIEIVGVEPDRLAELRTTGLDHSGNPVVPFIDQDGGWPLRCCLTDSIAGDELAIAAWSPFPWRGPYAEVGPIVVHARPCAGPASPDVPDQFLSRSQVLRPYGADCRMVYDKLLLVEPDGSLPERLAELLDHDDVDFVHARNVLSGCYSFTARRRVSGAATRR